MLLPAIVLRISSHCCSSERKGTSWHAIVRTWSLNNNTLGWSCSLAEQLSVQVLQAFLKHVMYRACSELRSFLLCISACELLYFCHCLRIDDLLMILELSKVCGPTFFSWQLDCDLYHWLLDLEVRGTAWNCRFMVILVPFGTFWHLFCICLGSCDGFWPFFFHFLCRSFSTPVFQLYHSYRSLRNAKKKPHAKPCNAKSMQKKHSQKTKLEPPHHKRRYNRRPIIS